MYHIHLRGVLVTDTDDPDVTSSIMTSHWHHGVTPGTQVPSFSAGRQCKQVNLRAENFQSIDSGCCMHAEVETKQAGCNGSFRVHRWHHWATDIESVCSRTVWIVLSELYDMSMVFSGLPSTCVLSGGSTDLHLSGGLPAKSLLWWCESVSLTVSSKRCSVCVKTRQDETTKLWWSH